MNKTSVIIQIKYYEIILFLIMFDHTYYKFRWEFPNTDLWMKLFVEEKMATIVE